jgi:hypothetical protein
MKRKLNSEFYELEKIRFIIKDACGLDVAYAYDNLVFAEHGLFLIQFMDNTSTNIGCWFNNEMPELQQINFYDSLVKSASLNKLSISYKGRFMMKQKSGSDEINIEFINS